MNDLPAGYDKWLTTPPEEKEEEVYRDYFITYGNEYQTFEAEVNGTELDAIIEAQHLYQEYGYAQVQDEDGNVIETF